MYVFSALIGKRRRDVTGDRKVLRDWDFPFIHRTVVTCFKSSQRSQLCLKKQASSRLCSVRENLFRLRPAPEKVVALGNPGPKISLKEDDVPTLFPVVEAMLMPLIRRTSTTAARLGSKRAVSELSASIQVMSAHGEFGLLNSNSIFGEFGPQLW